MFLIETLKLSKPILEFMKKVLLFLLTILIFSTAATAKTTIEIKPSTLTIEPGESFDITFYIVPDETISTVATDLITWDKDILECTKIEQGNLFEESTIWVKGTINEGKIINVCWASHVNTSTPGDFIIITFKAKQSGQTEIIIDPDKYGVAIAGQSLDREILNTCDVLVAGTFTPIKIDMPENTIIYIGVIISICIVIALLFIFKKKLPPMKKEKKGKADHEDIEDIFGN